MAITAEWVIDGKYCSFNGNVPVLLDCENKNKPDRFSLKDGDIKSDIAPDFFTSFRADRGQPIKLVLSLPHPIAGKQDIKISVDIFPSNQQWKVNYTNFLQAFDVGIVNRDCQLNEWKVVQMEGAPFPLFPWTKIGLFRPDCVGTLRYGLHRLGDGTLIFALVTTHHEQILDGLHLSRLDHYQQIVSPQEDGRGWFSTSGLFFLPLSSNHSSDNPPWRSITRWLPVLDRWSTGTSHKSEASASSGIERQDLLNVWNRTVLQVMASNRTINSGMPAVLFPVLSFEDADDKIEPYFLIRTDGAGNARLERASFDVPVNTTLKLCAKLIWQLQETLPNFGEKFKDDAALPRNDLGVLELIGEASGYSVSDFGWPRDNDGSENCAAVKFDRKKLPSELNIKSGEQDNGKSHPRTIFKLELKKISVKKSLEITVGSLKLSNISIVDKENAGITCILKGTWDSEVCDLYPEVTIDNINCDVFLSGTSDPKAADYFAAMDDVSPDDVSGRLEPYQRESAPLTNELKILESATLSIKVRCQQGRNSVTELTLKTTSREEIKGSTFYFQATPFIVANVRSPQFDEQVGEKFAYWCSDDPEGPQWRFGDATVEFTFPPQAVGEEMERGCRFYDQKDEADPSKFKTYIDKNNPVKYRFSPQTKMTVRPALVDRRFNRFGANLRDVLRQADVESFTTEFMYPVEMQFKRDEQRRPDVRISEIGEFFGGPAPELPQWPSDDNDKKELIGELLDGKLASWVIKGSNNFSSGYKTIRERQSIARVHYVQRLGVFQLYAPFNRNRGLNLTEGLVFRIRGRNEGAPVMNPLPTGTDLAPSQLNSIENFDWSRLDNAGAIRAGVLHTFEFASELVAVLSLPTSKSGVIESLALSALGASGAVSASFDVGRTTFSAESQYGQLSRLIKTRIGRIGVFWNRAKHVVVYERTCVPSAQFKNEQGHGLDRWPILRKADEYIELLEDERHFNSETDAKANRAGAVLGAKFLTKRIYVNGAWGADLEHGYEIPLWNEQDKSGFYPKPHIAMVAAAGEGETTRHFLDEPQSLFFYSNTERNTGSDTDKWRAKVCVDFRAGDRPGVFLGRGNAPGENKKVLERGSMPSPSKGSPRLPRFDFAVTSEGSLNLQHERGDTAMLARMDVLSLERTAQASAPASKNTEPFVMSVRLGALEREMQSFMHRLERVPSEMESLDCGSITARLLTYVDQMETRINEAVNEAIPQSFYNNPANNMEAIKKSLISDVKKYLLVPSNILTTQIFALEQQIPSLINAINAGDEETVRKLAQGIMLGIKQPTELLASKVNRANKTVSDQLNNIKDQNNSAVVELSAVLAAAKNNNEVQFTTAITQAKAVLSNIQTQLDSPVLSHLKVIEERISTAIRSAQDALIMTENIYQQTNKQWGDVITFANAFVTNFIGHVARQANLTIDDIESFATNNNVSGDLKLAFGYLKEVEANLNAVVISNAGEVVKKAKDTIDNISTIISTQANKSQESILGKYEIWTQSLDAELTNIANDVSQSALDLIVQVQSLYNLLQSQIKDFTTRFSSSLFNEAKGIIRAANAECDSLKSLLGPTLGKLKKNVEAATQSAVQQWLNSEAHAQIAAFEQQAENYVGNASQAIKLVKAIGELPELPHLTFNADRIEYVFDDTKKQIETSPFAVKLGEIGEDLKALGIAQPVRELADQFVGDFKDLNFNDVFRNVGGIDFSNMFSGFKLPNLSSDNVKITHGLDKQTRTAWVNSTVNVDVPQEVQAFGFGDLAVKTARMGLKATSDVRIGLDGKRQAVTNGRLIGDWVLSFGGARLVTFRDVSVSFDGSGDFKFDVSPDKIELHPTISFVSDIAKKFEASLPPYIKIEKDDRGNPIGASANLVTKVESPPPLGPVLIGPITILGGLALKMDKGAFNIESHLSVGTREAPIFVQVSFLGGGLWLEATAALKGSELVYKSTMGLALGSTRYFTIAGIAQGSYSFLLFASAQFKKEAGQDGGGAFVAGLLVQGNARILGFVSASISLLLQAEHSSSGETTGHGELNVSVQICWCYTFSVHQTVDQTF